jgi:hypothetical protein
MAKKITGREKHPAKGSADKRLQQKRLKLKTLHGNGGESRSDLAGLAPDKLPPASSSNAARQVRSRLNMTFPVDWQDLHTGEQADDDQEDSDS